MGSILVIMARSPRDQAGVLESWSTGVLVNASRLRHDAIRLLIFQHITPGFISSHPLSRSPEVTRYRRNLSAGPALLLGLSLRENRVRLECLPTSDKGES